MNKEPSRRRRMRRVALRSIERKLSIGDRWLLSFGDMLTLVLCFFICLMVSLDDATQKQKIRTIQDSPALEDAQSKERTENTTGSGTQLAKIDLEESEMLFVFGRESFHRDGQRLSQSTAEELKSVLHSMDWKSQSTHIGLCGNGESASLDSELMTSVTRLLSLRSQLIDTGFKTKGLKLDFREMDCDEKQSWVTPMGSAPLVAYLRLTRDVAVIASSEQE